MSFDPTSPAPYANPPRVRSWRRVPRPAITLALIVSLVLLGGIAAVSGAVLVKLNQYEKFRDDFSARYARLLGTVTQQDVFRGRLDEIRSVQATWSGGARDGVTASLGAFQDQVRRDAEAAGITVTGTRQIPVRESGPFEVLSVHIDANGSLEALVDWLNRLAEIRPIVAIEHFRVLPRQSAMRVDQVRDHNLTIALQVSILRDPER